MPPKTRKAALRTDISVIEAENKSLEGMIQRYQEMLVGFEFSSALGELEEFARRLRRHHRVEEDSLIPAYSKIGEFSRSGRPELFLAEHRSIDKHLEGLLTAARGLSPDSGSRRAVVLLVERSARLKALLRHHIRREETSLLPVLKAQFNGTDPADGVRH